MESGLYDLLVTQTIENEIARLGDPRLATLAPVDAEESHSALAQFLERLIASSLASLRGTDAADKQRELTDKILSTLADALDDGDSEVLSIAHPLQRLLAIQRSVNANRLLG